MPILAVLVAVILQEASARLVIDSGKNLVHGKEWGKVRGEGERVRGREIGGPGSNRFVSIAPTHHT